MSSEFTENRKVVTNPLGTEKISKLILKFSIPAIISMLVNAIYNIVDQIFIGHFSGSVEKGMLGIAATNVAFPLVTLCTALALLIGVGGASNFSLNLGKGDKEKAANYIGNSISLVIIVGVVIGVIAVVFLEPLLIAFGTTEEVMEYAKPYTFIIALGIPFMIFQTAASNIIRSDGSPSYAMFCMLVGAVFNVIADPIFIIVFDMGIAGIALATTLGQILSSAVGVFYLLKKYKTVNLTKDNLRVRIGFIKSISSLGAAACINQLAMTASQITMNNTLKYYGALSEYGSTIPISCVGVIAKINILFLGFAIGIAQGCQPINGFNYGAKNYSRVKETYKKAVTAATIISTITFLVFQLLPRQIISIFGEGSELYYQFSERYFRIFMLMAFINGIQPVTSNFFTSIGKAKIGIVISLTRQVLFLIPLILILPMIFGIDGVMYAGPIADFAAFITAAIFIVREMRNITQLQLKMEKPKLEEAYLDITT